VKKLKKIIGNKKGIDTILAALLMVVIVVVASVMVYAWSTGLLGTLLVTPQTGKEAMNFENSAFNSNVNVTLDLRNTGSSSIVLNSYYVKDSGGNQWSRLTWQTDSSGQHPGAIAPNALGIVYVSIGTTPIGTGGACGSGCTQTGSTFTQFSTGFSYTVVVVTSRNNQFSFTVTK
jgi:FlaG/FlaF family flagellin (archaellin)